MRELNPRAWIPSLNRYAKGYDAIYYHRQMNNEEGEWWCYPAGKITQLDVEIELPTGLKDKNGKEIYEGDIVRVGGKWRLAVVYTCAFCAFELQNTDREECMDLRHEHMNRYEVIGNIHKNPELLEGKE